MVVIAHRSGGPEADIVVPLPDGRVTGFLAETPQEYAEAMARVFSSGDATGDQGEMDDDWQVEDGGGSSKGDAGGGKSGAVGSFSSLAIRIAARQSARRFSNEVFDDNFAEEFAGLVRSSSSVSGSMLHHRERKEE